MQVSFGKIRYKNYQKANNEKQQLIEDVVENYFMSKNGKEPSVKTIIQRDLKADILVKHAKDGITTISLVSKKDNTILPFVPSLQIPNKLYLVRINEMVENFGEFCKIIAEATRKRH